MVEAQAGNALDLGVHSLCCPDRSCSGIVQSWSPFSTCSLVTLPIYTIQPLQTLENFRAKGFSLSFSVSHCLNPSENTAVCGSGKYQEGTAHFLQGQDNLQRKVTERDL